MLDNDNPPPDFEKAFQSSRYNTQQWPWKAGFFTFLIIVVLESVVILLPLNKLSFSRSLLPKCQSTTLPNGNLQLTTHS